MKYYFLFTKEEILTHATPLMKLKNMLSKINQSQEQTSAIKFNLYDIPIGVKFTKTASRMMVARDQWKRGMGRHCLMCT